MVLTGSSEFLILPFDARPINSRHTIPSIGDGVVRVYRNYARSNPDAPVELVTSWRGLNDRVRGLKRGSGLVLDWQQDGGSLVHFGRYSKCQDMGCASRIVSAGKFTAPHSS